MVEEGKVVDLLKRISLRLHSGLGGFCGSQLFVEVYARCRGFKWEKSSLNVKNRE
jgi:hypothetical protein